MNNSIDIQEEEIENIGAQLSGRDRFWYAVPIVLLALLSSFLLYKYHSLITFENIKNSLDSNFLIYLSIGIFAQLVDGMLGMGYGATSSSFLLTFGVSPAVGSMAVHISEMFTTGASAVSHLKFRNINKRLVKYLLLPGVLGATTGAYLLSDVIDGAAIKPYIAIYLMVLAFVIIIRGLKDEIKKKRTKNLGVLAVFGGFMDAVGGGGWGPIVTSTLIGQGRNPVYTIGSVNAAEFAVAFSSGITFMLFQGITGWQVILGLILGGVIAAPFGAYFASRVPRKTMTIAVGLLIIYLSGKILWKAFL
jgi:uncharacterized protein